VGTGKNERRGYDARTLLNGSRGIILDAEYGEDEWWLEAQFECDELPTEWWCETTAAILKKAKQAGIEVVPDEPPSAEPLPAAVIGAKIPSPPKPKPRALDPKTGLPGNVGYGYATTIHKAQGSEYKHVLAIVSGQCNSKQSLYTAFTRAKETLEIVGDLSAIPRLMAGSKSPYKERSTVMRALLGKVETPAPAKGNSLDLLARLAAMEIPEVIEEDDDEDFDFSGCASGS